MVSKRDSAKCDLRMRDVKIKLVHKLNYVSSVINDERKCDMEIQSFHRKQVANSN